MELPDLQPFSGGATPFISVARDIVHGLHKTLLDHINDEESSVGTVQSPRGCCSCLQGVWDICNTIPWAWREYWPWRRSNISCCIVPTTWFCDGNGWVLGFRERCWPFHRSMGTVQSPRGCCSCLQGVWDICNTIPWAWREYWPWRRSNISCYIVPTTWFCDGSKNHSYYWWKLWCWQLWDVRVQFAVPPAMSISTISDKVVVRIVECGSSDASFLQEI